jgi:hypothetical protein
MSGSDYLWAGLLLLVVVTAFVVNKSAREAMRLHRREHFLKKRAREADENERGEWRDHDGNLEK